MNQGRDGDRLPAPSGSGFDGVFDGVFALDGPSGTGKSTVARGVALRLGARYLDTGAMYRAATVAVLRSGVDPDDAEAVTKVVNAARIDITTDPVAVAVTLDGEPVDAEIRSAEVTGAVSAVSAVPEVRTLLVAAQRALLAGGGVVAEGRDIGTVVWPQARPKVFLTASAAERARRRAGDDAGPQQPVDAVAADLARRDRLDSTRATSPLAQADDALEVDTTDLDVDEVVARLVRLAMSARAKSQEAQPATAMSARATSQEAQPATKERDRSVTGPSEASGPGADR